MSGTDKLTQFEVGIGLVTEWQGRLAKSGLKLPYTASARFSSLYYSQQTFFEMVNDQ